MRLLRHVGAASLVLTAACSSGGGDNGGTNPPPVVNLGSIRPGAATVALTAGQTAPITVDALDEQGRVIPNPGAFTFQSDRPTVAEISSTGTVRAISAGTANIAISLTRNGITKTAGVAVTVTGTLPTAATVAAGATSNTFSPQQVIVARNATVTWTFGGLTHNVTFSGASPTGGNIATTTNSSHARVFPVAGDFLYDCTIHAGMTGAVFVR